MPTTYSSNGTARIEPPPPIKPSVNPTITPLPTAAMVWKGSIPDRSARRRRKVASQAARVLLHPLLDRLPRPGKMLRRRERTKERRIGRVDRLERAVGIVKL